MDFVYPYFASAAIGNELELSIASVRKFFTGTSRIVTIGDNPKIDVDFHLDKSRIKHVKDYLSFRDVLSKLIFTLKSNLINDEFVWMMDDIWFTKIVSIDDLKVQRYQGSKNKRRLRNWVPSNQWLQLKKKTMTRLIEEGIKEPFDYATHLPHFVEKNSLDKMLLKFNMPNDIYLWEILYNNMFQRNNTEYCVCLLYTSPSPRDRQKSRMPSSA